jgi:hypothetical protein
LAWVGGIARAIKQTSVCGHSLAERGKLGMVSNWSFRSLPAREKDKGLRCDVPPPMASIQMPSGPGWASITPAKAEVTKAKLSTTRPP